MNAYAYVVGPQDTAWTTLFDMAGDLGLVGRSSFRGLAQVEDQAAETPICFFLFSAVADVRSLRPLAQEIRRAPADSIRFAPLVYCAAAPSIESTVALINMGFDDIVALPQTVWGLRDRLARQTDRRVDFYQTRSYFGPDRRNRLARLPSPRQPTRSGGPFRRLGIVRDLTAGINVLCDEFSPAPAPVAAMQTLQQSA